MDQYFAFSTRELGEEAKRYAESIGENVEYDGHMLAFDTDEELTEEQIKTLMALNPDSWSYA